MDRAHDIRTNYEANSLGTSRNKMFLWVIVYLKKNCPRGNRILLGKFLR